MMCVVATDVRGQKICLSHFSPDLNCRDICKCALIKKHETTIFFLIMYIYVSYNALYRINSVKQSLLYMLAFIKNNQQPIF